MRKRNMISKAAAMGLAVLTAASLTLTGCSQPAGDKETAQETQQTAQAAESETQAPEAAQRRRRTRARPQQPRRQGKRQRWRIRQGRR